VAKRQPKNIAVPAQTPAPETPAAAPETLPNAGVVTIERKDDPAADTKGANTNLVDSLGNSKTEGEVTPGPRGPEAPPDTQPAKEPVKVLPKLTVTDKIDSAGTETPSEHHYVPGPRGPEAARFVKDSYRS
jgi:hypothetical protein